MTKHKVMWVTSWGLHEGDPIALATYWSDVGLITLAGTGVATTGVAATGERLDCLILVHACMANQVIYSSISHISESHTEMEH